MTNTDYLIKPTIAMTRYQVSVKMVFAVYNFGKQKTNLYHLKALQISNTTIK